MQLIKVVSGSPFKVGERSGKTPRCEGYSRRWRKCTGGAVYSNFDVFLQEQTAAVVSCLDDSTHLVPFGGSEGLPHPTTALTSGVFVTGRKCRPSESPSKDKALVGFSFLFFWPASSNFFCTFNKKHSSLGIFIQGESRSRNNGGFQTNPRCVLLNLLPLNYIITYKKAHTLSKQRLLTS